MGSYHGSMEFAGTRPVIAAPMDIGGMQGAMRRSISVAI
jgi:hypothetical protein